MGRSLRIEFTVEMITSNAAGRLCTATPAEWRSRARNRIPGHGAPNTENLLRYVRAFEASTKQGGCNEHLGLETVVSARIVRQSSREVLAQYKA